MSVTLRDRANVAVGIFEVLASVVLIVLMLHSVINVVTRSFFNSPLQGTTEISGHWYLPLIVFLGLVVATVRNEHIEARLMFDSMSKFAKRAWDSLARLLAGILVMAFAIQGFLKAQHSQEIGLVILGSSIPYWQALYITSIAMGITAAIFLGQAAAVISGRWDPESESDSMDLAAEVKKEVL